MLLKCAINGQDANWGRVLCAVGYSDPSGFTVDPTTVSVSIVDRLGGQDLLLLENGEPLLPLDEERALELLKREDIDIKVRMGQGSASATYYTCDLSHVRIFLLLHCNLPQNTCLHNAQQQEYVSINADCKPLFALARCIVLTDCVNNRPIMSMKHQKHHIQLNSKINNPSRSIQLFSATPRRWTLQRQSEPRC